MEKKGEILNQLAIISDLVENVNIECVGATITFDVKEKEFINIYNYTSRKNGDVFIPLREDVKSFTIGISNVNIIINKSNV